MKSETDLHRLCRLAWRNRLLLLKACAAALAIGLVVAFSLPKEYAATAKLAPEANGNSQKMGELGGLAAIAGVNLGSTAGADAISPELYPDVVASLPFLLELLPVQVTARRPPLNTTLYDYLAEHQRMPWWDYIASAPQRAAAALKELLSERPQPPATDSIDAFSLTPRQLRVVNALRSRISLFVDKKTTVVTVNVRMQDALVAATLTRLIVEKLQEYITRYRTQKARQDLMFTEKIYTEAREAYYRAQQAYARFEDANKNIVSASYRTEQERLKNEMSLTFNVYNSLAQKYEQDKLKVQEQTPAYFLLDPATVPLKATSPNKPLILLACLFMSLLWAAALIVYRRK